MSKLSKLPKLGDSRSASAFDSFDSFDRGGREAHGATPNLCVQCHTNPPLGTLTRCRSCVRAAAELLARFVAASPKGERNDRLYRASCRVRELVSRRKVSEASSIQRLTMAAAACGLVGPEVLRTIRSGLEAASKRAS